MSLVPVYRPRPSPLHATRAGVGAGFCCALALTGALYRHPLVLGATLGAIVAAGLAAGVGSEIRRSLMLALPLALLVTIVNPLVYPEGETLLVRGGELLGRRIDITLEATLYGALTGMRVAVIVVALGLLSAAVDPDELLRLFRRVSYRSALTASLANRLVPVLARDATRMGDAARCRPHPPGRLAVVRAALSGALERSVDVAAALEVRGYALGGRPPRRRRPWSRHDFRFLGAALGIAGVAVAGAIADIGAVQPYPSFELAWDGELWALSAAIVLLALAPFAGRSARLGVGGIR
jgi:energy-coupling factor transport system permease protein